MEDDELETSSGSNLVPIALAVLAIVLGGAGLYFGLTANQRLNPLSESMEAGTSSAARLEKDISALEIQVTELSAQKTELKKTIDRMRVYSNQSEKAVKQVAGSVKDNREEIVKLAERINDFASSGVRPKPAAATANASGDASQPAAASGAAQEGTYTIESGDTFAKVAPKLGVGLQALLDANPDADPRRLRIGQVINVPGN